MRRLTIMLVLLLLVSAFAPITAQAQDKASTVTVGFFEGDPKTLDPQAASNLDEFNVLYNVYEGLVGYDPKTLAPVPLLAEKYEVSQDGKVYKFTLRKGVKFHNGRAMTADDVKFSLERLGNPDTGTSYTSLLLGNVVGFAEMRDKDKKAKELSGVKVVDPQTVEITLTAPTASFLQQLTLPGGFIVPKESATKKDFGDKPDGTGPYRLGRWTRQQQLVLEANPDYWGGAPAVKTAVMRVIPQASQQVIEFEGGNIDVAVAPESDLARISGDTKLSKQLVNVPILSLFHLRMNLKDPTMSKPEVRLALALSIDRDAIVKTVLGGKGAPAYGLIPPGLTAYDKDFQPFKRDVAKAKDLLAKAGYKDGVDIEARTGQVETEVRVLTVVSQQAADAGIRLKVTSTEKSIWDKDRADCKMQVGTIAWGGDYADPDDFTLLVTGQAASRKACGLDSYPEAAAINKLLDQASKMPVGPDRDKVFQQVNKMAMDVAAIIPIYHGTRNVLINSRLQGQVVDSSSNIRFASIKISN